MIMKTFLPFILFFIVASSACVSQSREQLSDMTEEELFKYRQYYIENFDRIGLNTTPGDAKLLRILVESTNAQRGVEVGSATGYGALLMGMGFEYTGGQLFTIDIDPDMVKACRQNIENTGLVETVTCMEGDALEVIPKLEGEFDFVFLDAQKSDYFNYFKAIEPKLAEKAVIVADNVIKFENAMQDFLTAMQESYDYDMEIIQASEMKGDGMAVIFKKR